MKQHIKYIKSSEQTHCKNTQSKKNFDIARTLENACSSTISIAQNCPQTVRTTETITTLQWKTIPVKVRCQMA